MNRLINKHWWMVAVLAIILVSCIVSPLYVYGAADYRLKAILDEEHLYFSTSISSLNNQSVSNHQQFKENFDGTYVVISGEVTAKPDNKKLEITNYENRTCTIDTSENGMKSVAESIVVGDMLCVYGKISCKNDKYTIIADHIDINPKTYIGNGRYTFYNSDSYKVTQVNDVNSDGNVTYYVPDSWNGEYVRTPLNNNGISGSQYFLNAIYPQNTDYPEIFYVFYFTNETYLDSVPRNPSNSNYHAIEKLIIQNILQDFEANSKIDVNTDKDANGLSYDSCQTSFKASDGRDYKLEFIFRHDDNGIVCMLYLYYPNDEAINHLYDVALVVESMEIT
ncbi:MAG: OB-fold nucleic acid binding domain-containing protein [Lachnospiraceae bacterium]|nr:OB-fold nucleic acid binding domain-containing protein [Lachnospiraceae bacterium]